MSAGVPASGRRPRPRIGQPARMNRALLALALTGAALAAAGCAAPPVSLAPKEAAPATVAANRRLLQVLPFSDRRDFEDARRGFVATIPDAQIRAPDARVVWSMAGYGFLDAPDAPATVNPSLFRQAQLNQLHGLFKVIDRVYQVRSFDLSNMTIVEGDTGLIVIDPLISVESARAALELYRAHRPARPVVAVIYTHSHVDHFGGVRGVVDEADVQAGRVRILAPQGFMESAVSENVIAGNAMTRRAQYMYGAHLAPGARSRVDAGLGRQVSRGRITLIAPTDTVARTGEARVVDGVEMVFQLTPGAEAPAEMNIHFPRWRLLNVAENVTRTMHNVYTIRGAEVRDALAWSKYIEQTRLLFGSRSDTLIAQHHWPSWGQADIDDRLRKHRDLYKFIHDQSVRLLNHGKTPREIAEAVRLPDSLASDWSTRGYYGTLSHNAKAVYQRYLGWYDANPANLDPLAPAESARRLVEYMGGADAVVDRARKDFERGEFRWVAEVMNQVALAEPGHVAARALAADALEQMGYQAEAGTWRNAFLSGAHELRHGKPAARAAGSASPDVIRAVPFSLLLDYLAVRLDPDKAAGKRMTINWVLPDTREQALLRLENSVLSHAMDVQEPDADVTVTLNRSVLDAITLKHKTFAQAAQEGAATISGRGALLRELFGMLDEFEPVFDIVPPARASGR